MSLPTHVADLPFPPGNSGLVRAAATDIRSTLVELRKAHAAALRIELVCDGAHWRGDAFDAFRRAVEVKPLPDAVDHASSRMAQAADNLDWFAGRFEEHAATIRWCRSRLAALGLDGTTVPEELVSEVQRIQWDFERAWDGHRDALRHVAEVFDWLDDQPTFATPPPSNWDRVRGAAGHVVKFGHGIIDATWEMVKFSAELSLWLHPVTAPYKWRQAWENREQIVAVLQFAWDNPRAFATELGKAMIDLESLQEGGVAFWLGRRVPDVVLALATGGLGTAGTAAAMTVRGTRGATVAVAVARRLRITHRLKAPLPMRNATDAAAQLGRDRIMNRLNRLGADAGRLDRVTDAGAFSRTDTRLGQFAQRLDQSPVLERLRQLPGKLNDEIKGFTQWPSQFIREEFAGVPFVDNWSMTGQRRFDNLVTSGLTGQLGIIDGLAAGAPALSPETRATMIGVLGIDAVNHMSGLTNLGADIAAAAMAEQVEAGR